MFRKTPLASNRGRQTSEEVFDMVAATVSRTSFGVISVKTQKNCVFALTSHIRIRNLFSDLTDQSMDRGSFFKRRVKGGKRVETIINEDKQFDVKYSFIMAIGMGMAGLSIICKLVTGYKLLHMTAEKSWYLSSI